MYYLQHRRKHFRATSNIAYTECWFTQTPTGTGWKTYTADSSIPANAVVQIVCRNSNSSAYRVCGASAYSASDTPTTSTRYIDIMYAQDTNTYGCYSMFVQLNASKQWTGYAENTSDNDFVIVGYWTGVTFTEAFTDVGLVTADQGAWVQSSAMTTPWSGTANSVTSFLLVTSANVNNVAGVRNTSSSTNRYVDVGRSIGGDYGICMPSLLDASGYCDFYIETANNGSIVDTGHFDTTLTFTEDFQTLSQPGSADTWTDVDLSSYLDQDGRVVDVIGLTSISGANTIGMRKDVDATSDPTRYIALGSIGSGEYWGWSACCNTSATGNIQIRCTDTSSGNSVFYFTGYYKPA